MSAEITIEELKAEAHAFLAENAKLRLKTTDEWGIGSDRVAIIPESTPEQDALDLENAQKWSRKVFDAGFGWISGPKEYGGRGLSRDHERAYRELEFQYDTAPQTIFGVGLGMVAPTIQAHGTQSVKEAYLHKMYRGDIVGCQLFSEPGAGSDLASVQTRAIKDGDEWIINGQKVWTSFAHLADIGEIIARTNPDAPKHKGLSGFVVDMRAKGVEVRPLRQMSGGCSFNEVFFNDVRIPDSHLLGDVNGGWSVALTTLMNERAAIGGGGSGGGGGGTSRLVDLARQMGRSNDPLIRQQLAQVVISTRVARYTTMRAMAKIAQGAIPGPEMSIAKMALTENLLMTCDLVSSILGPKLIADSGAWGTYAWGEFILDVPGMRVAGGTDEVLRNIVGERVLGLPKEPVAN